MTTVLCASDTESFRAVVAEHLGLRFDDGKLDFLADVLRQRMEKTGCDSFSSYQRRLVSFETERDEIGALAEDLTVNETYFFRYAEHFQAFTELVIPTRIRARGVDRRLRILSAGCASGEEAYSLAILIRDRFPELASWEVEIRGVDVSASMVKKALRGRYSTWSLRETPADLRSRYFRPEGRELLLDDAVRSAVTFEERNLREDDPVLWQADTFDIVFCRNVTMYLTPEVTRFVIARIARSLVPGGFLFLGHAETLRGVSQEFHLLHTHETFYYQRRGPGERDCSPDLPSASAHNGPFRTSIPVEAVAGDSWFNIIRGASERIANLTQQRGSQLLGASGTAAIQVQKPRPRTASPTWDRALAVQLMREERFAEAIELLYALPKELMTDTDTQLLLAVLLTNGGDLPEAEKVCDRVLKLDELNAGAHYLMALCREHAGDREAAMGHDQAAAYLDSAFAMPHLHLGLVAKRAADVETARRELGQALPLLEREDASRILLFGGGFTREALVEFCRAELRAVGGTT
jgi:chemotaxis protein methyltransferase CheR